MGILDKAKQAAVEAKAKAEQARGQGRAKIAQIKQNRERSALYRSLGEAVYVEQRKGGDHAAVDTALAALDTDFATAATDSTGTPPPPQDVPPAAPSPADTLPASQPAVDVPPGG